MKRRFVACLGCICFVAAGACAAFGANSSPPLAQPDAEAPAEAEPSGSSPDAASDVGGCGAGCEVVFSLEAPHELLYDPVTELLFVATPTKIFQWSESDGGAPVQTVETSGATRMAVFQQQLFWLSNGSLMHSAGNVVCQSDVSSYVFGPDALHLAKTDGTLHEVPAGKDPCGTPLLRDTSDSDAFGSDGSKVYRARANGAFTATIIQCGATCASGTAVVGPIPRVGALALDTIRVYWTEVPNVQRTMGSYLQAGGRGPPPTFDAGAVMKALVAKENTVYFTTYEEGGKLYASADAKEPDVLLSGLAEPWGVAVAPGGVYVAEAGKDRVIRVRR
jgi:hypothetical protein